MNTKTCPLCAEEIQEKAIKCRYCGGMLNDIRHSLLERDGHSSSSLAIALGVLLIVVGVGIFGYFFVIFDITVQTDIISLLGRTYDGERVHNIGLMQDKQNGVILGSLVLLIGIVVVAVGFRGVSTERGTQQQPGTGSDLSRWSRLSGGVVNPEDETKNFPKDEVD